MSEPATSEIGAGSDGFFRGGIIIHLKLLFVAAAWGLAWAAGRELALALPEAIVAWYRYAITIPLFFVWLYFKERGNRDGKPVIFVPRGEMFWKLAWIAFFSTFLYQLFFMHGMARTAAGDASVIITFNPGFTALLAVPLLHRSLTPKLVFGLVVGLIGVAIVTGWSPNNDLPLNQRLLGDFLIMCAAASWAISTNLMKRILEAEEGEDEKPSALAIITWSAFLGWLLLTPLAAFDFIIHGSAAIPDLSGLLWLLYLAVISTVLAYAWFADGVDVIGGTAAATYVYLVPFFGILSGVLLLNESIGWSLFAGFALILVGVKVAQQSSNEA
jgi:drug/metabolite transporter (DMT)-like permease